MIRQYQSSIDAAQKVLDAFMAAFNARDIPAFEETFNFPSVRFASNTMVILNKGRTEQDGSVSST